MRLVRRSKMPELFAGLAAAATAPIHSELNVSPLGRRYYEAIEGAAFRDESFLLEDGGDAVALVECNVSGNTLARYGAPIEIRMPPGLAWAARRVIVSDVLGELKRIAGTHSATSTLIRTTPATDAEGFVASAAMAAGAQPDLELRAVADLSLSEAELLEDLRPGFRRHVRKGEKLLRLVWVDESNQEAELFDRFRTFHAEVAGRVTRPMESWQAMLEFIRQGKGAAVFGWLGDELVAATMTLDAQTTGYYASGVYHRGHFDKPLAHICMFHSMLRCKQRGCRYFDVGEVPFDHTTKTQKEAAIGYFKHGFTSRMTSSVIWKLRSEATE